MRAGALIALLLAAACWGGLAAADDYTYKPKRSVFGKYDQRIIENSRDVPWRAVGRFNRAGRGHCTATVVAPRIVVTAAHCVVDKLRGGVMTPDALHFVAGWDRGDYLFHSIARDIVVAPGYDPLAKATLKMIVHDWALIVLAEDPSLITGVIRPAPYTEKVFWELRNAKTKFTQAGYSGDRGQVLTAHEGCPMWGFTKGLALAEHGCQAVPGDSGSPIVYKQGDTWHLVAVHSAHDASRKGFAVPSSSFMPALAKLEKEIAG